MPIIPRDGIPWKVCDHLVREKGRYLCRRHADIPLHIWGTDVLAFPEDVLGEFSTREERATAVTLKIIDQMRVCGGEDAFPEETVGKQRVVRACCMPAAGRRDGVAKEIPVMVCRQKALRGDVLCYIHRRLVDNTLGRGKFVRLHPGRKRYELVAALCDLFTVRSGEKTEKVMVDGSRIGSPS